MAFGGHYLSDVLLGGLVTLIIIEIARMLVWPRGEDPIAPAPDGRRGPDRGRGGGTGDGVAPAAGRRAGPLTPPGALSERALQTRRRAGCARRGRVL